MSLLDKIKLVLKLRKPLTDTIEEVKHMKSGFKSSEFWMQLAVQAGAIWSAVQGFIPPKYALIIATVGTAVYTIARTALKAYQDVKAATAAPIVATETTTTTVSVPAPVVVAAPVEPVVNRFPEPK